MAPSGRNTALHARRTRVPRWTASKPPQGLAPSGDSGKAQQNPWPGAAVVPSLGSTRRQHRPNCCSCMWVGMTWDAHYSMGSWLTPPGSSTLQLCSRPCPARLALHKRGNRPLHSLPIHLYLEAACDCLGRRTERQDERVTLLRSKQQVHARHGGRRRPAAEVTARLPNCHRGEATHASGARAATGYMRLPCLVLLHAAGWTSADPFGASASFCAAVGPSV